MSSNHQFSGAFAVGFKISTICRYAWQPGGGSPKSLPIVKLARSDFWVLPASLTLFAPRSPRENSREFSIVGPPFPDCFGNTGNGIFRRFWESLVPLMGSPREIPYTRTGPCHQGLSRGPYNIGTPSLGFLHPSYPFF